MIFSQPDKKGTGKKEKPKSEQVSAKALLTLQTQLATFDKPIDAKELHKRTVFIEKCAVQQLEYLFNGIHHEFLPMNDLLTLFVNKENAKMGKKELDTEPQGIGKFFEFTQAGFLRVKACPLEWAIKFIALGPGADIRKIWDYELYKRDFLITHTEFISSVDLVKGLRHYFTLGQPEGLNEDEHGDLKPALTVLKLLMDWLVMETGTDFHDNDELAKELDSFIKDEITKFDAVQAQDLAQLLHATQHVDLPFPLPPEKEKLAPKPILPKKGKFDEVPFFNLVSPIECARQMTLLDELYFQKILAREFLGGAWTKKYALTKAPNLTRFINHTNRMTNWVVTEIIAQKTLPNLVEYITFWIKVGEQFQILKNYSGVMNILTALHSSTISRLRNAWKEVKQQDKDSFDQLTDSLSLLGHFKNYREEIKKIEDPIADGPCIPLIAVTCSDLNGLGEVLENKTDDGWINFDKHQKISDHIWAIKRVMRGRYNFRPVPEIKNYIEKAEVWSPAEYGEKTLSIIARFRNEFCSKEEVIKADKHTSGASDRSLPVDKCELTDKDWDVIHSLKFPSKPMSTKYSKNEIILELGNNNKNLSKIKKGSVRGEVTDFQSKAVVTTYSKDQCLSPLGLLSEYILYTHNYVAEENCEIVRYDLGPISKECVNNHAFGEKVSKLLCAHLNEKLLKFGTTPDTQLVNKKLPIFFTQQQKNDDRNALLSNTSSSATASFANSVASSYASASSLNANVSGVGGHPSSADVGQRNSFADHRGVSQQDLLNPKDKVTAKRDAFAIHVKERHNAEANADGQAKSGSTIGQRNRFHARHSSSDGQLESVGDPGAILASTSHANLTPEPVQPVPVQKAHPNLFDCCYKNFVGKLFLTKTQITFTATSFGRKIQEVVLYSKVLNILEDERDDTITIAFGEGPLNDIPDIVFRAFGAEHQQAYAMINGLLKDQNYQICEDDYTEPQEDSEYLNLKKDEKNLRLEDWDMLLEASKPTFYPAGTVVMQQGTELKQRLFHIGSGACRVEKELDQGLPLLVEILHAGSVFGEQTFMHGPGYKAQNTITTLEDTYLIVMEGFFLDIVFDYFPDLYARFYFYLACELFKRLKLRYKNMNSFISNPTYNIPKFMPADPTSSSVDASTQSRADVKEETTPRANDAIGKLPASIAKMQLKQSQDLDKGKIEKEKELKSVTGKLRKEEKDKKDSEKAQKKSTSFSKFGGTKNKNKHGDKGSSPKPPAKGPEDAMKGTDNKSAIEIAQHKNQQQLAAANNANAKDGQLEVATVDAPSEPNLKSRDGGDATETLSAESTAANANAPVPNNDQQQRSQDQDSKETQPKETLPGEVAGGDGTAADPEAVVTAIVIEELVADGNREHGANGSAAAQGGDGDEATAANNTNEILEAHVVTATVVVTAETKSTEESSTSSSETYDEEDEIKREMARIESEIGSEIEDTSNG